MCMKSIVRWTESPHSSFHWLSRQTRSIERNHKKRSAFKNHLNFASLCKSSLLIERFFFPPPTVLIFSAFPSLRGHCCVCAARDGSVCVCHHRASVHSWKEGEKKNFRKTNCWKKRNDIAKKECIQPPRWRKRKNIVLPIRIRTMNTQTFLKKKYVDGINYWSWALTTSAKKKRRRAGARKWNKKYKINRFGTQKKMTSHEGMCLSVD